jgi:phosphatidylserine decarboxylase
MLARDSYKFVITSFVMVIISLISLQYYLSERPDEGGIEKVISYWLLVSAVAIFLGLTIFLMVFFRDPERQPPGSGITAPADGVIKSIEEETFDGRKYFRIITFMNVHNVHVNRIPIDCEVISIEKVSGGFLPAYKDGSVSNNQVITELSTTIGTVRIIQIVGIFARRIVVYLKVGDKVQKGERLGMIRFGSRVDLILPKNKVEIKVKPGDISRANITTFAELKK